MKQKYQDLNIDIVIVGQNDIITQSVGWFDASEGEYVTNDQMWEE